MFLIKAAVQPRGQDSQVQLLTFIKIWTFLFQISGLDKIRINYRGIELTSRLRRVNPSVAYRQITQA